MVKSINKINKNKYEKKNNTTIYLVAGVAIALVIGIAFFMASGSGGTTSALMGPAPSGNNCPENIAYLQSGVDKYKQMTGQFPTDLSQLTLKNGDKSILEKLPKCPSGNLYIIENGKVIEAAPKQ